MMTRILLIFLSLGILSTVNGCYFDPSPYDSQSSYRDSGPYQGRPYREGRGMTDEERQYRKERRAQERAYRQEERERDDRPDWRR